MPDFPTYEIKLPLPPSVNDAYAPDRRGGIRRTAACTRWVETAGRYWRAQFDHRPVQMFTGRIRIQRVYVFKDERVRDISNFSKVLDDFLQGKLYRNDSQIDEEHSLRRIVRAAKSNKVFVYITQIGDNRFMDMLHPDFSTAYND